VSSLERTAYPQLCEAVTPAELQRDFTPTEEEKLFAVNSARRASAARSTCGRPELDRSCLSGCFSLLPPEGHIMCGWRQRPHTWAFAETTG
jgi:hypothetical protein